jgi:hypothetical protein
MAAKQFFYLNILKETLKDVVHVHKNIYTIYGDYYWEIDGNLIGCEPISSGYRIHHKFYDGYITASPYSLLAEMYTKYNIDKEPILCPVHEKDYKKLKSLRKLQEWCTVTFTDKYQPKTKALCFYIFDTRTKRRHVARFRTKEFPCRIGIYLHE